MFPQKAKSPRPTYRFACFILVLFPLTLLVGGNRPFGNAFNATAASRIQEVHSLEQGKPIARELAGNQTHSYQITASAGQLLHVVVEQQGIDVVVVLYDPNRKKIAEVDSPNGNQGPESLILIVEASGDYRLEIHSLEENAAPGPTNRYSEPTLFLLFLKYRSNSGRSQHAASFGCFSTGFSRPRESWPRVGLRTGNSKYSKSFAGSHVPLVSTANDGNFALHISVTVRL